MDGDRAALWPQRDFDGIEAECGEGPASRTPRRRASFRFIKARQRIRLPRKERGVAADGDEEKAAVEHPACFVVAETQESRRLAGGANALARLENSRLHLAMLRVGEVAHIGGEIGRADEDAVDAVHGGDGDNLSDGFARLALDEHANLLMRALVVSGDAPVTVGPRRAGEAADAVR